MDRQVEGEGEVGDFMIAVENGEYILDKQYPHI